MPTVEPFVAPRTLQAATQAFSMYLARLTSTEWRLGQILIAIHDFGLFRQTQIHDDFLQWLREVGPVSESYARKLMYFARVFDDERDAAAIGVTKAIEVFAYADLVGADPRVLVRTDTVINGRPLSQHTRKSLVEARQAIEMQNRNPPPPADEEEDDAPPFERLTVFTPPEKLRAAAQAGRQVVRWMEDEGAVGIDYVVRPLQGEGVLMVRIPLDQVRALLT